MDASEATFAVTNVRARQELKEVNDMCTQAQRIINSNPRDMKELLDWIVVRARVLTVRFDGFGRTMLEDAMFHQACTAGSLDLTSIQKEILWELMDGGKQAKGGRRPPWRKRTTKRGGG